MSTTQRPLARRTLRILAPVIALAATLVAVPAHADVPVGWSEPDPVSPLGFLFVVIGAPIGLMLVIALVVLVPGFSRGEGLTGKDEHADDQWFGGRSNANELTSGDSSDTPAIKGGASGSW